MKKLLKNFNHFLISPIIVTTILLIIYVIKGIYPFGEMTVANGDMAQSYMTFYYFLYDIFHNGKSVFYDYILGMGSNMYGGFMVDGLLNPTTFIILLGSRANIPYMFSFVLILKFAFIGLTSYILFNKLYKNNKFYNVIFSVLYALSGYSLMYNTNLMWLDVVGLFPLFILAIKYMFETNKVHWYAIVLALMLIFNYNLSYMVLMFIIFVLPIYIHFGLEKDKRKKAVFNVILGTILSVGLSAFSFIPSFNQVMSSYRMSGVITNTVSNINILFKIVVFIFYALPIYGYINWLKNYKDDKNNILMNGLALIFTAIIPILFERVNLLWHTGSYQMFPYRYGFIPILILYIGALNYFSKIHQEIKKESILSLKIFAILFWIFGLIIGLVAGIELNLLVPAFNINALTFAKIFAACILIYISMRFIYEMKNDKTKKVLISALVILQVLTYTYGYVGVFPEFRYGNTWSDEMIFFSNQMNEELDIDKKTLYRLKDLTASTTENCPLVYNIPSMSTFLHIISKEQVLNCNQLGYSHSNTKLNDFGGTIFSDAVYGIKYVLTKDKLPEKIYTHVKTMEDGSKLYEYRKNLPFGILYSNDIKDIPEELRVFDAQNYLYKNLFNKQDEIIEIIESESSFEKEENNYKYTLDIHGNKEVYMYLNYDANTINNDKITNIIVNGKELLVATVDEPNNREYPVAIHNGILDLGYFENEQVIIEFESNIKDIEKSLQIGILDIEKYDSIFQNNDTNIEINGNILKIKANVENDIKFFIPINYDKGWQVINSNIDDVEIKRVYNTFIGFDFKKGENIIELEFKPHLYNTCLKITLGTILLMVIVYLIEKKINIRNIKFIMYIFWILGIAIYVACLFKIYIMSIIQTFIG